MNSLECFRAYEEPETCMVKASVRGRGSVPQPVPICAHAAAECGGRDHPPTDPLVPLADGSVRRVYPISPLTPTPSSLPVFHHSTCCSINAYDHKHLTRQPQLAEPMCGNKLPDGARLLELHQRHQLYHVFRSALRVTRSSGHKCEQITWDNFAACVRMEHAQHQITMFQSCP